MCPSEMLLFGKVFTWPDSCCSQLYRGLKDGAPLRYSVCKIRDEVSAVRALVYRSALSSIEELYPNEMVRNLREYLHNWRAGVIGSVKDRETNCH